jgi:hypothetical protein
MSVITFTWQGGTPADIGANAQAYIRKVQAAVKGVAGLIASYLQQQAQLNAIWTDRTGAAREGLATIADVSEDLVSIYLAHTVSYGIFLELAHGGKYSIIMRTIESALPKIYSLMQSVFKV